MHLGALRKFLLVNHGLFIEFSQVAIPDGNPISTELKWMEWYYEFMMAKLVFQCLRSLPKLLDRDCSSNNFLHSSCQRTG